MTMNFKRPAGHLNPVLVTGGAGYIGSVCVAKLLDAGYTVSVLDNLSEGHREAVDSRAHFYAADLACRESIARVLRASRAQAVIHFAANALVGESMANPGKYFRNNLANGLNLLEAAVASGVKKIVPSSTCATYGWPENLPIAEDTPQRPINPYGESKLMFERLLHWFQEAHGLQYTAFRYFNAAGATTHLGEDRALETHLIPNVLKVALGQKSHCEIFGDDYPTPDGTCIRDYLHVEDIAHAHLLALAPGNCGFYNLGNGEGYSVKEVIAECEHVCGVKIPAIIKPRRPGDPPRLVASAQKAAKELGWQPAFPKLHQIVASAWHWHRQFPHGYSAVNFNPESFSERHCAV